MEHTIGSVKRCRIVKDKLRCWQDAVRDMVMAIGAELHNLLLRYRSCIMQRVNHDKL